VSVEEALQELLELASRVCAAPMAAVSLVDADQQWFRAQRGFDADGGPLSRSLCALPVTDVGAVAVADTLADPRTLHCDLVVGEPRVRSYVGAPLLDDRLYRATDGRARRQFHQRPHERHSARPRLPLRHRLVDDAAEPEAEPEMEEEPGDDEPANEPAAEPADEAAETAADGESKPRTPEADAGDAAFTAPAEPMRRWVDSTGTHQTRGWLVEATATHVRILKVNGRFTTVTLDSLSPADRDYVSDVVIRMAAQRRAAPPRIDTAGL
jgi:hypothetical protein